MAWPYKTHISFQNTTEAVHLAWTGAKIFHMKKSSHSYEDPISILGIVILPNSLYGTWSDKYKFFLFGCVYKFSVHILNISEFGDSIPMDNSDILRSKPQKLVIEVIKLKYLSLISAGAITILVTTSSFLD